MEENPYEPPRAPPQSPVHKGWPKLGRYEVGFIVVVAVVVAFVLVDALTVKFYEWQSQSNIKQTPENKSTDHR
jgi:hypothetical protein